MDFIKKHFEKILLALALLILIGVAGFLAFEINKLSNEVKGGGFRRQPTNKGIDKVATGIFTNAIAGLENPSLWHSNSIDPFKTETQYIIVPRSTDVVQVIEPFTLKEVKFTPFQLIFMSYTGTNGENIAINFLKKRSYLGLKVGDEIIDQFASAAQRDATDTGYRITKFEHKEVPYRVPGIDMMRTNDVSELTIQHANGNAIILILDTVTNEKEPRATLLCVAENNREIKVHKGANIACGGKPYKVVDISSKQVIILDIETNEQHFITLPGAKELPVLP